MQNEEFNFEENVPSEFNDHGYTFEPNDDYFDALADETDSESEYDPELELEMLTVEYDDFRVKTEYLVYKTIDDIYNTDPQKVIDYFRYIWEEGLLDIEQFHKLCLDKGVCIRWILSEFDIQYFNSIGFTSI